MNFIKNPFKLKLKNSLQICKNLFLIYYILLAEIPPSTPNETDMFTRKEEHVKSRKIQNYLWTIFFIKKFIEKLKKKTLLSKISKLNLFHLSIIKDNSSVPGQTVHYYNNLKENIQKNDFFTNRRVFI